MFYVAVDNFWVLWLQYGMDNVPVQPNPLEPVPLPVASPVAPAPEVKKTNKIPIFAAAILLIVFLVAGGFFFLSSRTSTPKTQTAVNTNNPNLNNPKPLENVINDTTKDTSDQQVDRDLQEVDKSLDEADVNNTEVDEGLNDKQTNLQ